MGGLIYAMDLAVRTGFAFGEADGAVPASGSVVLKRPAEHAAVAFGNLIAFLNKEFVAHRPATVVVEAMLPLQAYVTLGNGEAVVNMARGLHAIVTGMCNRFGIAWMDVADSKVRKHFIGRGRMGSRDDTKRAVIRRCHLLKLMPADCHDDNRADALAVWDWAAATLAHSSVSTRNLVLFEQKGTRP